MLSMRIKEHQGASRSMKEHEAAQSLSRGSVLERWLEWTALQQKEAARTAAFACMGAWAEAFAFTQACACYPPPPAPHSRSYAMISSNVISTGESALAFLERLPTIARLCLHEKNQACAGLCVYVHAYARRLSLRLLECINLFSFSQLLASRQEALDVLNALHASCMPDATG
jgi:hypothetical protein